MFQGLRIAVVVPAFREERLVGVTLASIPDFVDDVFVVDDASDDRTSEVAAASGDPRVRVLRHAQNRGVGAAIVTGYEAARDADADVAVVMAGDAQMDAGDLPALLAPLVAGTADYVKGNRLAWPGATRLMPTARFIGNHALSSLTRLATGLAVADSQCGYTAIGRRALVELPLRSLWSRYGYPNDLLGQLARHGLRVVDVPVRPVYGEEISGIGLRHALVVIPFVLLRVVLRRAFARPERDMLPADVSSSS